MFHYIFKDLIDYDIIRAEKKSSEMKSRNWTVLGKVQSKGPPPPPPTSSSLAVWL
jgi:hypothetical protein